MDKKDIQQRFDGVARSKTFQNILNEYDLKNKSVFDVGCTYGEFLAYFGEGSQGVTIVKEETDEAVRRGLNVVTGNVEDSNFSVPGVFDVVFANNIFEHLYSPHNFLIRIKKNLKPDGVLILGVPCIPKIVFLLRLKKFRGSLASNHINYFTYDTLVKTVKSGGWDLKVCRSFHFKNRLIDRLIRIIVPHFYVVATPVTSFEYSSKRKKELKGYGKEYEN